MSCGLFSVCRRIRLDDQMIAGIWSSGAEEAHLLAQRLMVFTIVP
jgi:hypothetical protein